MGSHTTQGIGIAIFLISFVALGGAFAAGSALMFTLFLILFGISVAVMIKCKAIESGVE